MYPHQVAGQEDDETSQSIFAARVLSEGCEHFQHYEYDLKKKAETVDIFANKHIHTSATYNICVHHMVQPTETGKKGYRFSSYILSTVCVKEANTHLGKNASNAFGNTNSLSMAINDQNVTPTFSAIGYAKVANM
jgi:hypothetical protein